MCKVSVIIPVYNKQQYIHDCLSSVLQQSFKDFEVVIVNDGSTDDSEREILEFHDNRIRLITVQNGGVSRARNIGIEAATGEYICFVDSDDTIDIDYLDHIVKVAKKDQPDLLFFGLTKVYIDGSRKSFCIPELHHEIFYQQFMHIQDEIAPGIIGFVCNKLIKRKFLQANKIKFDPSKRLAEDLDFYINCLECNPVISFSQEYGYYYVQEAENSSIKECKVDYFSLLDIWMNAYLMLKDKQTLEGDNKRRIFVKMQGLFVAHFLESSNYTFKTVLRDLKRLQLIIQPLDGFWNVQPRLSIVQMLIKHNCPSALYLYLQIRKLYHLL